MAMNGQAALLSWQSTPLMVQTGPAGVMGMMGMPDSGCTAASLPVLPSPGPLMGLAPFGYAHCRGLCLGCGTRGLVSCPPAVGLKCPRASQVALGAVV